jgi:signal transduction histidine kinase
LKKTALVFLLAIFIPALVLGGLALRTAGKQQVIIERQEAELRQKECDALAEQVRLVMSAEHQSFVEGVRRMLGDRSPEALAKGFSENLTQAWSRKGVGFAVTTSGIILSPERRKAAQSPAEQFLFENRAFLGNEFAAEIYSYVPDQSAFSGEKPVGAGTASWKISATSREREESSDSPTGGNRELDTAVDAIIQDEEGGAKSGVARTGISAPAARARRLVDEKPVAMLQLEPEKIPQDKSDLKSPQPAIEKVNEAPPVSRQPAVRSELREQTFRKVAPQQQLQREAEPETPVSNLKLEKTSFGQIVSEQDRGIISRFVQDQLEIIFWVKFEANPNLVFGFQVQPSELRSLLSPLLESGRYPVDRDVCLAILDDRAKPFAKSLQNFDTDWKRPFVATEVGEVLPHWEVGLYLTDPTRLIRSARLVQLTLVALIALALGAIAFGSYLVVADTRRQLAIVQKKTDFVSNVSHELKTPLTSIRMFAELLHDGRVNEESRKQKYLHIIMLEAERLTRLINNVLDFSKMERKERRYHKKPIDLHTVIRKVWDSIEMHLESKGFETRWEAGDPPYRVNGDEDALASVIVNLLSNAEKYSTEQRSIELHSYILDGWICVSVLDRGSGVPAGEERRIFEHFYRAHDSLSSGIQGSGLGLTLAMWIAKEHGGTIVFERRRGGGSRFTLRLPEITDS